MPFFKVPVILMDGPSVCLAVRTLSRYRIFCGWLKPDKWGYRCVRQPRMDVEETH
jgi:hypothetical protein